MCQEHEHHTHKSSEDYSNLCFTHSVKEVMKGNSVYSDIETYPQGECDACKEVDAPINRILQKVVDLETVVANDQKKHEKVEDMLSTLFHINEYAGDKTKLLKKIEKHINS